MIGKAQKRNYSCIVCGSGVEKPPCRKAGEKTAGNGLGHWHCLGNCRGKIKVRVELVKEK